LYFEGVRRKNKKRSIDILVLKRSEQETGFSAPKYVVEQINKAKKAKKVLASDEFFVVLDRDCGSTSLQALRDCEQECRDRNHSLVVSNPCFEIWLLLHVKDLNEFSEEEKALILENREGYVKALLRAEMGGYNPSNPQIDNFWPHTKRAIDQAKSLDVNERDLWPEEIGTRVYKILERIF